jgi:hypothetical protein
LTRSRIGGGCSKRVDHLTDPTPPGALHKLIQSHALQVPPPKKQQHPFASLRVTYGARRKKPILIGCRKGICCCLPPLRLPPISPAAPASPTNLAYHPCTFSCSRLPPLHFLLFSLTTLALSPVLAYHHCTFSCSRLPSLHFLLFSPTTLALSPVLVYHPGTSLLFWPTTLALSTGLAYHHCIFY